MNRYEDLPNRRFYRNSERGMIAGVCAGVADYFGFNLCATRALTFIMFLMFMPVTIVAYIGCVLLVPSDKHAHQQPPRDPSFRREMRSDPGRTLSEVRRRFQSLDTRLARLERYVTSSRFNLDQEFRNL